MKKEIIVAIVLGLALGLVISYGVYRARKSLQNPPAENSGVDMTPNPTPTPNGALILLSPQDETIQATKEVKITGTAKPNVVIVIFVNDTSHITTADASGNFSIQANLDPESNVITVRALDENGNTTEVQRTVIYSTSSLDEVPTASFSASPSPSPSPTVTRRRTSNPSPSPIGSGQ